VDFFNLPNSSSRTMALGSTQSLTEMSTRNLPGGLRVAGALRLRTLPPFVYRKCGNLDVSQPYGPSRPVTGIALRLRYKDQPVNAVYCEDQTVHKHR
jgi:hypothetical protein